MPPNKNNTKFASYLPQGDETTTVERRESYEKAVVEAEKRRQDKELEVSQALQQKDWLVKFKRVWQDGQQTGVDL